MTEDEAKAQAADWEQMFRQPAVVLRHDDGRWGWDDESNFFLLRPSGWTVVPSSEYTLK